MRIHSPVLINTPDKGQIRLEAGYVPPEYEHLVTNPAVIADDAADSVERELRTELEAYAEQHGLPGWARMSLTDLANAVAAHSGAAGAPFTEDQVKAELVQHAAEARADDDDPQVVALIENYTHDQLAAMLADRKVKAPKRATKVELAQLLLASAG